MQSLIRRWRWLRAWKSVAKNPIYTPRERANNARWYNAHRFWWQSELVVEVQP